MRSIVLSAGLFTAAVFAGSLNDTPPCDSPPCISAADAQEVADHFETLISNYSNASATAYLTANFTDYSSGVNSLIDSGCADSPVDLNSPTFTSLTAFEAGQGSQPNIPFEQLNLWYNCDTVFLRWRSKVAPDAPEPVTGIIAMETVYQGGSWLIQTVYSEFNSGAWLVDLGLFTPVCNTTAPSAT